MLGGENNRKIVDPCYFGTHNKIQSYDNFGSAQKSTLTPYAEGNEIWKIDTYLKKSLKPYGLSYTY